MATSRGGEEKRFQKGIRTPLRKWISQYPLEKKFSGKRKGGVDPFRNKGRRSSNCAAEGEKKPAEAEKKWPTRMPDRSELRGRERNLSQREGRKEKGPGP